MLHIEQIFKMKAEIKEILETENFGYLKDYYPENPNDFCINISMEIGIFGQEGTDYFYTSICSFDYLNQLKGQQKTFHQRELIIMEKYDYQAIMAHLNRIVTMYDENDWHTLANQLNKYFLWEFDDYRP
ncbi:Imm8 family immunity protein [Moraxella lacunata]|uniref:Imm8 family immunity protein n=1 Tax=Moraxella lacunata TaxID=477 RepID=UPI0011C0456D|nr:Imm8 family immunity protein [Moraxella lacunata]